MTRTLTTIAIMAAIALPAAPLLGGTVPPRDCGDLMISAAQPQAGLAERGPYDVIVFSRDEQMPAPGCRKAMQWSRAYAADRDVPRGFKVKAIRGKVGRAFLRIGNEDVGFRVIRKQ